jgi:hypothetical protein
MKRPPIVPALFDAFIAHEDGRLLDPRAVGAFEEFDRLMERLPPEDRRALRAMLALIEWLPLRRFSRLSLARRRRFLDRLARGPVRLLRSGVAALKSLVMLAYWTREATWPAIGYDGPWLGRVAVEVVPVPRPGLIEREKGT